MALKPPPPPVKSEPGSFAWMDWYRSLYDFLNGTASIAWSTIDFVGSNITDIAIRLHNTLQSLQGGTAGEYYHLTAADYASIQGAGTVSTKTGNYTATAADSTLLVDATSAAVVITFPLASSLSGKAFTIKKIDASANAVTITPTPPDLIDGSATAAILVTNVSLKCQSNGTNWYIL